MNTRAITTSSSVPSSSSSWETLLIVNWHWEKISRVAWSISHTNRTVDNLPVQLEILVRCVKVLMLLENSDQDKISVLVEHEKSWNGDMPRKICCPSELAWINFEKNNRRSIAGLSHCNARLSTELRTLTNSWESNAEKNQERSRFLLRPKHEISTLQNTGTTSLPPVNDFSDR